MVETEGRGHAGVDAEAALIDAARKARLDKHPSLRRLVVALTAATSQAALAAKISWSQTKLSEYMTGMKKAKHMSASTLSLMHADLTHALRRAGQPCSEMEWMAAQASAGAPPPPPPQALPSLPVPPPSFCPPTPIWSVDLADEKHHTGGQLYMMAIGAAVAKDDEAWAFPCPSRGGDDEDTFLRLRIGLRGRITFGPQVRGLGGRTIEWEIERLHSPIEIGSDSTPLWVAWEVTGIVQDLLKQRRIIGRAIARGGTGHNTGRSTPWLMWRAVEAKFGASKVDALACCGLTHPKVQALLEVANRAVDKPTPTPFGSRSDGLAGLTQGGSHLRQIAALGYTKLVEALNSICPGGVG